MVLRQQSLKISALIAAALSVVFLIAQGSNAQALNESAYKPVASPFKVSTGDKVEVAELFWYGCGHCYALEPSVKKWSANKPANAELVKIPAIFNKRWEFHGRAHYTMEALGAPSEAYDAFFHSIHVKRQKLNNTDSLVAFLATFDFSEAQVMSAFNSFEVDSKVRAAAKISRQSGATGVPTIVVDGKYMTSQGMANGVEGLFKTVDLLVEKAASER